MKNAGLKSVASDGFESPTVCVFYVKIPNIYEKFA
jgi:aspartate aminotransferase-like enzyme